MPTQQVKGGCKCILLLDFMEFGECDISLFLTCNSVAFAQSIN
jgi:hypothetical protein